MNPKFFRLRISVERNSFGRGAAWYRFTMFKPFLVLFLSTFFSISIFGGSWGERLKENGEYIYLDKDKVLNIVMIDNMNDIGSLDRFYHFEKTLNELLDDIDFPMEREIHEFGSRIPKDEPCVFITVQKWSPDRWGGLEVRLNAYMRSSDGTKNRLGNYRDTGQSPMFMTGSFRDRAYNDMLRLSLTRIMRDLEEHFPLPEGVQEERGDSLEAEESE